MNRPTGSGHSPDRRRPLGGRNLARRVLDEVHGESAYANLALNKVLGEHPTVDRREKAFCTDLVYGTLRNLLKIDFILGRLLSRPLVSLKIPVQSILRLALYQLMFRPDIPEWAVCHCAVAEVKNTPYFGLAALVNGVLRSYLRSKTNLDFPKREADLVHFLEIEYSHPGWLIERWLRRYGPTIAEQILRINNEPAPLALRLNRLAGDLKDIREGLAAEGVEIRPGFFLKEAVTAVSAPGPVEELTEFQQGRVFVQDENAMLAAYLLNPLPGELVIDLCAAPGGKSTHMAELMGDQGEIFSIDNYPHKVELIRENVERLKLKIIKPTLGDARNFSLGGAQVSSHLADGVLVDAPCSGTGVLRRRIDARYRRQPGDIPELVKLQREILYTAASLVKPGGRLVYSTCTLEPEENEEQIKWFLGRHPEYKVENFRAYLPEKVTEYALQPEEPWLTILPVSGGGDGFFMCRMKRLLTL
ncbi:MAG: 16S rRNA (cytosine(967)-C(5))-methyltransferase RsmB [Firmicutes bacterium]|nr:16S rRNA (cytosine(967)-C(5))-methyltransferase RsmB [Bacillota bacterium]